MIQIIDSCNLSYEELTVNGEDQKYVFPNLDCFKARRYVPIVVFKILIQNNTNSRLILIESQSTATLKISDQPTRDQ